MRLAALAMLGSAFLVGPGAFPGSMALADVPSGYPDASNTGLSDPSVLEKHVGSITVTEDNTVIENLEIHGTLWIQANNVTVRNVWIYTSSFWTIFVRSGSLLIEHTEIGHPSHVGLRGIGGSNVTGRYLDIHHVEDGIKLASNDLYEYVYIHDQASPNSAPHTDAVQADGGARNSIVRHSTLDCRGSRGLGNAAVILKSDLGPIDNILIENSYLNCGNYTFYSRDGGNGNPTNITLANSVFGPDHRYGFTSIDGTVTTDGRVLQPSGEPLFGASLVVDPSLATPSTTVVDTPHPSPPTTEAGGPSPPTPTTSTQADSLASDRGPLAAAKPDAIAADTGGEFGWPLLAGVMVATATVAGLWYRAVRRLRTHEPL